MFQISFATIKTDKKMVALQAMEFLISLYEEKREIMDEVLDTKEHNMQTQVCAFCA